MTENEFDELRSGDLLSLALDWRNDGRNVAIATVVSTWGSSPRPAGSNLIVADDGRFEGSVSAGCVEGAVIEAAMPPPCRPCHQPTCRMRHHRCMRDILPAQVLEAAKAALASAGIAH